LRDAALQLFSVQGYDATSTEEIAERAGVSARTFFRYFPTKESVLFGGKDIWFDELLDLYRGQPASLSDVEAMRAALIEVAPRLASSRQTLRLYGLSLATSLILRGLRLDYHEQNSRDLAAAVAARRGLESPDETCTLLGAIGVMAHRRALETWVTGSDDLDLAQVIAEKFELLAAPFASENNRAAKRKGPSPARPARPPRIEAADEEAQQVVALEEIRVLNRRVRSASRRQGLAGVSRLLRRSRNMKFIYERPPTK
jgi:AcrR family transcriptional regulator